MRRKDLSNERVETVGTFWEETEEIVEKEKMRCLLQVLVGPLLYCAISHLKSKSHLLVCLKIGAYSIYRMASSGGDS